ncbi:MAG: tetratricopeptide repeat protein [Pyrinomonadaceae bacterium]
MNTIPQYCQKCREKNALGEPNCRRCGTRLMLVVFPQSLKYDTNYVPTYYEDHLLERVTSLEMRLSQVTERLAATLDLMLRQSKSAHSDHILLETLIESLNTLGAVEKEKLTKNWQKRLTEEEIKDNKKNKREKLIAGILETHDGEKVELFEHLISEGFKLLLGNEEKQGLRTLERALDLSPKNVKLLVFIAQTLYKADKFEAAKNYLEKAFVLAPENSKILLLLAVIYADESQFSEAKPLINSLLNNKEKLFCANYLLGMTAAFEENWFEALSAFKETLAVKQLPETQYLIGCAYFQLGRYKIAQRHLRKAVEKDSGFADAWYMQSVIYGIMEQKEKAQEAIELAWLAKEVGAQCLEFLNRKSSESLEIALPFLRFKNVKKQVLTSGSSRLTKLFNEELSKVLD